MIGGDKQAKRWMNPSGSSLLEIPVPGISRRRTGNMIGNRFLAVFITLVLIISALLLLVPASADQTSQSFFKNVRADDDGKGQPDTKPDLVVFNETVYIVYEDTRDGDSDIRIVNSTDGGYSYNPSTRVDDTDINSFPGDDASDQSEPDIAVDSLGNLYVVWRDNRDGNDDIYFSKSTDGGDTWSANVRVDDGGWWGQYSPCVPVDKYGDIYVAWADERNSATLTQTDIFFTKSTDGGTSFDSPSVQVDDAGSGYKNQEAPDILVDDQGLVFVVWADERIGDFDIYSSISYDAGSSFNSNVMVSQDLTSTP